MDDTSLRKVQLLQLEIGKEIKRICDKNQIDYFLDSGTLLGAVRHKGFIPWDDDMDIGMTRENYEKFLKAAQTDLRDKYFLQTWETDKNYPMPFAKVRLNGTMFVEQGFEKADFHQGIYVDVFPYDNFPDEKRRQKRLWRRKNYLSALLLMKCRAVKFKSTNSTFLKVVLKCLMFSVIKFLTVFYSKKRLIKKYEKNIKKFSNESSSLIYEQTQSYTFGYWVVDKECLNGTVTMPFEDTEFKCLKNYDKYLTEIYGDYMQLPPEEKRKKGHSIVILDFGDYDGK